MEKIEVKPVNALELDPEKDDEIEFERDSESNEVDKIMKEDPAPRQETPTKHNNFLEPGISQSPRLPHGQHITVKELQQDAETVEIT